MPGAYNIHSAIKSPQVLELSGIGDPEILEAAGIKPIIDLPGVGANAQDHIICMGPMLSEPLVNTTLYDLYICIFAEMKEDKELVTGSMLTNQAFAEDLREGLFVTQVPLPYKNLIPF